MKLNETSEPLYRCQVNLNNPPFKIKMVKTRAEGPAPLPSAHLSHPALEFPLELA